MAVSFLQNLSINTLYNLLSLSIIIFKHSERITVFERIRVFLRVNLLYIFKFILIDL